MDVKTSDLPGIGKKYSMTTVGGKHIVVLLHLTGNREIYYFDDPDDDPLATVAFSDEEARKLGAILLGVDYQPVADDRMDLLLKSVRIEWLKVDPQSQLMGKTIAASRSSLSKTCAGRRQPRDRPPRAGRGLPRRATHLSEATWTACPFSSWPESC
jgi:K+/H+ antiporter YhaU regulatory subunit KhtT